MRFSGYAKNPHPKRCRPVYAPAEGTAFRSGFDLRPRGPHVFGSVQPTNRTPRRGSRPPWDRAGAIGDVFEECLETPAETTAHRTLHANRCPRPSHLGISPRQVARLASPFPSGFGKRVARRLDHLFVPCESHSRRLRGGFRY